MSESSCSMEAKQCIIDGDLIFPPSVNKYCGGCDYLVGCPLEHKIRTEYKDKIMHKLDDHKDPKKKADEEEEQSKVDLETSKEAKAENQASNAEAEGTAASSSAEEADKG